MTQDEALTKLVHLIDNEERKEIILKGYAGTGKTYLISMLIKHYNISSDKKIAILAPTNQAVEVIHKKLPKLDSNTYLQTIHSYLRLKRRITRNGKIIFVKDENIPINEVDLIIVDEASMIDERLYHLLFKLDSIKLYVGDPAQIPPVKERESIPMRKKADVILDKIIRQVEDSPIIKRSMIVRNNESLTAYLKSEQGETCIIPTQELDKYLVKLFNSEQFERDSHYVKVIAWTNKVVNEYNNRIRQLLYGDINKITYGEKLIAAAPIALGKQNIEDYIKNNTSLEVTDYTIKYEKIKGHDIMYYYTTVKDVNNNTYNIKIIHEDSEGTFTSILESIKDDAIKYHNNQIWVDYYKIIESFARVKYNYAVTCHKAQGSTYNNVIIIYDDIIRNKDHRLLYTAITRASQQDYYVCKWK